MCRFGQNMVAKNSEPVTENVAHKFVGALRKQKHGTVSGLASIPKNPGKTGKSSLK